MSSASDSRPTTPLPEAGLDPGDPNRPISEERDTPAPPVANPHLDMDATEEADADSDNESVLSEVDEAQFEDFDPANIAIEDRAPVAVDDSNIGLIGVHKIKRKRDEDAAVDREGGKKKRKEARREKPKKGRKRAESDNFSGGEELEGRRIRKKKDSGERKERAKPRRATPENEDAYSPEERRRRALDRAMDEALKNPNKRRRKADGIDLESMADAEIEDVRRRMADAAKADTESRDAGQPAMHKLKMLPEVVALLNRNTLQHSLVDPDINLLEAVRFFLEPLNDGSLPAYNIQRELFAALAKLPVNKDTLVASGIGKVILFYTKSKRPELSIKRQAEKLLGEWTRPILKRSDDYRKREFQRATYDPTKIRIGSQPISAANAAAEARARALAPPVRNPNRARMETDLLDTLPTFPVKDFSHLLPSLERSLITTTDLITLDALEIAKRAQLPLLELRRLSNAIVDALHTELGVKAQEGDNGSTGDAAAEDGEQRGILRKNGRAMVESSGRISMLDALLDDALGGGIPTGYLTEVTGESGAGKTQLLLTLLLAVQMPSPHGLSKSAIYVSTEAPLSTQRLYQLLRTHPLLTEGTGTPGPGKGDKPSLSNILSIQTPDLESQDHILRYQVPVAVRRHNVGLVIIDSIAANFRAEMSSKPGTGGAAASNGTSSNNGAAMAQRSADLTRLGALLRSLAHEYDVAIVVSNQVADRFEPPARAIRAAQPPAPPSPQPHSALPSQPSPTPQHGPAQNPASITGPRRPSHPSPSSDPLTLDHQQRWFTGWGDIASPVDSILFYSSNPYDTNPSLNLNLNLKTPSLGLVWTNQIAARITLLKEPVLPSQRHHQYLHQQQNHSHHPQPYENQSHPHQHQHQHQHTPRFGQQQGQESHPESAPQSQALPLPLPSGSGNSSSQTRTRTWRRYFKVVFASYAEPDDGIKGTEFEIVAGGVRGVAAASSSSSSSPPPPP
ncbi:MAG: hypothetical protein M1819_005153 [Sarea resinae]|nr:MAG: hypothetical protein M1819_005153 [Sarea resinae]